jgi:hypothetical protein
VVSPSTKKPEILIAKAKKRMMKNFEPMDRVRRLLKEVTGWAELLIG